ncbi:MAG: hypothetical protein EKK37_10100 [Sphingobacteriales bacterium]|nr:MAG: hypothetical protein EKK37_10100 [Sphingobacteriales bacterium]
MNFDDFIQTLQHHTPPTYFSAHLQSLWYDGKGDWEKAHQLIQDNEDDMSCQIHAYLHRKEGDKFNASYWYNKAGKPMPHYDLEQEWEEIVKTLL